MRKLKKQLVDLRRNKEEELSVSCAYIYSVRIVYMVRVWRVSDVMHGASRMALVCAHCTLSLCDDCLRMPLIELSHYLFCMDH